MILSTLTDGKTEKPSGNGSQTCKLDLCEKCGSIADWVATTGGAGYVCLDDSCRHVKVVV